jgi:NADH dehydrogenase
MTEARSTRDLLRVLILGGGFGGVYAAKRLRTRLARLRRPVQLTLVNRDNFLLFTPMLHEVAASDLDLTHIVTPLRKLIPNATLFIGEVEAIDLKSRIVTVSHAGGTHWHDLDYDHLVLALGSVTNFLGLPGVEDHCLPMKSLSDAIALRNRMIEVLEEADFECAIDHRHSLLGFVVAGGGFAGVETLAAMNDFLHEAIRFYGHLEPSQLHLVLVHAGDELLPELGSSLGAYARSKLAERGVDIRLSTRVNAVSDEGVALSDGTTIPAQTIVWTAGTAPHPTVAGLPCTTERGRVVVDEHLRVPDWPGVWALGDCALVPDPANGSYHPPTAQHALREAKTLADNIIATELGEPLRLFSFKTIGQLAATGRRTGVARMFGRNFSGFFAWWLWRTVYLAKLPRFERKVRVAIDWTLDLLFTKDLVQVKALSPPRPEAMGDLTGHGTFAMSDGKAGPATGATRSQDTPR